ncbi:hypothetical protein PCANC_05493 [Puccinia coronata f. sp. avenae]|uniref:Uncharacterized protein n=1 Tax=Puccinia coronata f. sp. avenae TaxID=200324 RepID=A0A2N5T6M1_9BASI|nr:hypothetical protein PCANC_05493 [Puccinia coronata f. sp. avenae]
MAIDPTDTIPWTTPKSPVWRNQNQDLIKKDGDGVGTGLVRLIAAKFCGQRNMRAARFFLKSLTCGSKLSSQRRKHDKGPSLLSQHVQSLQFSWGKSGSMGNLGASLFCKILQSCPLLENIFISNPFPLAFNEPMLEALASKPFIKELVLTNITNLLSVTFQWPPNEIVSRLFSHWNSLETVEFSQLSGWPRGLSWDLASNTIPVLNCAIRTMTSMDHDLDELTLSNLLRSCGESMRTLKTAGPPALLDAVFDSPNALRNLKTLSFHGNQMATDRLLALSPKSLLKLSMERCNIVASCVIEALVISSGHDEELLPNLS